MSIKMYNNVVSIGGKNRRVVTINHQMSKKESVSVGRMHHILLLDRSHSMSREINDLMENVKTALSAVPENDLVTIIWFAGAGEYKTVVQGAAIDENLNNVIDGLKSTVGTTCFSEPLAETGTVVEDLKALCPNYSVTLFTDGHPVVPWNADEEENRISSILDSFAKDVIAINTIGYGSYYNQKLLLDIAQKSQYGVFNHSNQISDYAKLFGHNYERVSDLTLASVEVKATDADLLYVGDKNTMLYSNEMQLNLLAKRRNQVFIIGKDETDFSFEYEGETFNTSDIQSPKLLPTTTRNMYYALAYNLYYLGEREQSLDILLADLGDKALVDSHMNAFTWTEVENHAKRIRRAIFKTKYRYTDGVCEEDYLPSANAPCIMDVFKVLAKGNNEFVAPIGKNRKYKRIGQKVVDVFGKTELDTDEVRSPFDAMILNEEKMNVSFRVQMPIKVYINPKAADRVGLPHAIQAKQYRSFAIVKDGGLNMSEVEAILDASTFDTLSAMGLQMAIVQDEGEGNKRVILDMMSLPIISRAYTQVETEQVYEATRNVAELKTAQKVLNFFLKNLEQDAPIAFHQTGKFSDLTPDQIQVLQDHGINTKFDYVPVKTETERIGEEYETRSLDFNLKNHAAIPKVEDVMKKMKDGKKLTPSQDMMASFITETMLEASQLQLDITKMESKEFLQEKLKETKTALLDNRMFLSIVKMGKILTGSWFEGLEPDGKGNFNFVVENHILVVKPKRVMVSI